MKMFKPGKFETTLHGCPSILLTRQAAADMWAITDLVNGSEVGWFCTVRRDGSTFVIEEVFLPEQEAHATTCELTAAGQVAMIIDAKARDKAEGKPHNTPESRAQRMKCWVHSHVNMGVGPSGQDETQFDTLAKDTPWYIRGIVNKKGDARFDMIFTDMNVKLTDLSWTVEQAPLDLDKLVAALTGVAKENKLDFASAATAVRSISDGIDPERRAFWEAQVKEKVKGFTTGVVGQTVGYPVNSYGGLPAPYQTNWQPREDAYGGWSWGE